MNLLKFGFQLTAFLARAIPLHHFFPGGLSGRFLIELAAVAAALALTPKVDNETPFGFRFF